MVSERFAQDAEEILGAARSAAASGEYEEAAKLLNAAAQADTDGRFAVARDEVFLTLVFAMARSEGQTPEEYAVQLVRSMYEAAFETAVRDAGRGVEAFGDAARCSRQFAPLMGEEPAAVFDAAIGYQTAAVLRGLGRWDEAVAAFDGVVARHSGSTDKAVQYWLGLCMVNCAQLLLQPKDALDHPSVRKHAFALVDQMFDELGTSKDPEIRVRLVRAAELEVFSQAAIGRVAEASKSFQRFEPHLAFDDAKIREDFERWRFVVGQTDDGPLSEDLLRVFVRGEARQAIEGLAHGADPEDVASAEPELLTDRVAALLEEAEAELPKKEAAILRRNREKLQPIAARGPKLSLDGPIQGLAGGVGVRFSLETACGLARRLHFVCTLAQPYVDMLCALCESRLEREEWRRAWQLVMVLRAAAQRLPVDEPRNLMMIRIGVTLLRVAETAWATVPDRRTYDTALEVGEELLALGAQYDDAVFTAMVHESLARMLLTPYVRDGMGDTQYFSFVRRWVDRLDEEVTNLALDPEPGRWEIPLIIDDVERAEAHVRTALIVLPAEFSVGARVLLQDAYVLRKRFGLDLDGDTRVAEAEAMLDVLGGKYTASPDVALRALLHLRSLGVALTLEHLRTMLGTSPTELRARWGDAVVLRTLLPATIMALTIDRDWGLQLLEDHRDLIHSADEDLRLHLLRNEWTLLTSPRFKVDFNDLKSGPIDQKLADIDERARTQGWPDVERTRSRLLAAALRLEIDAEGPDDELVLLGLWDEEAGKLVGEHESAMESYGASVFSDMTIRAIQREDWAAAIRWQGVTIEAFLDLRAPDAVLECLTLVDFVCGESEESLGRSVVEAMYPLALRLDVELGDRATRLMHRIWQRVLQRELRSEGRDGAVLLVLLQLSKGLRFAAALQAGEGFDVASDEIAAEMLSLVQQSESQLGALGGDDDDGSDGVARWELDDFTLVMAYDEELDPIPNPTSADLLENLQRSFDARVQRLALGGERNHEPILEQELLALVPESSALLLITFARDMEDKPSFVWLLATPGRPLMFGTQPFVEEGLVFTARGRRRLLDPVGGMAGTIRSAMQQDPAGKALNPEARSAIDYALDTMLGPGVGVLRDLLDEGVSHLVVVPHGGLHFVPFPALHLDGRPLIERLAVTMLPNLALLRPRPMVKRATEMCAIGLDFADGAFGLPPLPEAVAEAKAVAELFGAEPLLPPDATESAIVFALQSATNVHLATHGEHAVPAPSFQRVYAIPSDGDEGRLAAHELMRADLRGLRLVTLSACETALGRFDLADNVLGIPAVLLLRGAETVVGTLWEVETTVSQDFFVALYRGLQRGLPRGDAFAHAQREVRGAHPQYRDWAAFQLMGDWR